IPTLTAALKDKEKIPGDPRGGSIGETACLTLGNYGPKARAAIPALIDAAKGEELSLRERAMIALGAIGPEAKAAVTALREGLRANELQLRIAAAGGLGRIGPEAKSAVPLLIDCLTSNEAELRVVAARALAGIGPEAITAKAALVDAYQLKGITDPLLGDDLRCEVIEALGMMGEEAKDTIPLLVKALGDQEASPVLRARAAKALG